MTDIACSTEEAGVTPPLSLPPGVIPNIDFTAYKVQCAYSITCWLSSYDKLPPHDKLHEYVGVGPEEVQPVDGVFLLQCLATSNSYGVSRGIAPNGKVYVATAAFDELEPALASLMVIISNFFNSRKNKAITLNGLRLTINEMNSVLRWCDGIPHASPLLPPIKVQHFDLTVDEGTLNIVIAPMAKFNIVEVDPFMKKLEYSAAKELMRTMNMEQICLADHMIVEHEWLPLATAYATAQTVTDSLSICFDRSLTVYNSENFHIRMNRLKSCNCDTLSTGANFITWACNHGFVQHERRRYYRPRGMMRADRRAKLPDPFATSYRDKLFEACRKPCQS